MRWIILRVPRVFKKLTSIMSLVHRSVMAAAGLVIGQNFFNWHTTTPSFLWLASPVMEYLRWPVALTGGCFGLIVGQFMKDNAFPTWYTKSLLFLSYAAWLKVMSRHFRDPRYSYPLGPKLTSINHYAFGTLVGFSLQALSLFRQSLTQ